MLRRWIISLFLLLALNFAVAEDETPALTPALAQPSGSDATGAPGQDKPAPDPCPPAPKQEPAPKPSPAPTPTPTPNPSPAPTPTPMPPPQPEPPSPQPDSKHEKSTSTSKNEPDVTLNGKHDGERVRENVTRKAPQINPKIKITKIHDFRNDDNYHPDKNDALQFEKDYWSWGAITAEQNANTKGQYFVITWVNNGERSDFTTKFEYRQVNSKALIRSLQLDHSQVKGATRSIFSVVGPAYQTYGAVYAWRFTVLRGGELVAEDHSFVW